MLAKVHDISLVSSSSLIHVIRIKKTWSLLYFHYCDVAAISPCLMSVFTILGIFICVLSDFAVYVCHFPLY